MGHPSASFPSTSHNTFLPLVARVLAFRGARAFAGVFSLSNTPYPTIIVLLIYMTTHTGVGFA